MSKKLSEKLRGDVRFNPFHEDYDLNHILDYIKELGVENIEVNDFYTAFHSFLFNIYYKDMTAIFKKCLSFSNLSKSSFSQALITLANRDMYLIQERTKQSFNEKEVLNYDEISNSLFESKISGFGLVNAQAGLEAGIDGLNIILNFLNRIDIKFDDNLNEDSLNETWKTLGVLNLYTVSKTAYELVVWEGYNMIYNKKLNELKIKCPAKSYQIYNRIGEYRLERNIFAAKSIILSAYRENNTFYKSMTAKPLNFRRAKRLKSVTIIDGTLLYKLASGQEKQSIFKELLGFAELINYYPFIQNHPLPKFHNISIYDIIIVFSEIQHLFEKGWELPKVEKGENNVSNFNKFKLKISKHELMNYLNDKTNYSKVQISQMLQLFTYSEGYYNVWEKSLIQDGKYLYPVLVPFLNPNKLRLMDFWLEEGGFNLHDRGKIFEQYLKITIVNAVHKKGYFVNEIKPVKFKIGTKYEEVDLIIELQNVILISEVKCIKFPFNSRDFHNMHKRLKNATVQLQRKIDFLELHQKDFPEITLDKKIVPAVITNYPMFSGLIENGIPIIDSSLIDNYFINGGMNRSRISFSSTQMDIDDQFRIEKYYQNETQFNHQMEIFFRNPVPVVEKLDDLTVSETLISLPNGGTKIILDFLNFKSCNVI